MPPKGKRKPKQKIEIKESRGFVIGDFATVINNFWDEQVLKRFHLEQRAGFILIALLVIGVGVGLYSGLRPKSKGIMAGEFNIAIASFMEEGSTLPNHIGYTVGEGLNLRLSSDLQELTEGSKVKIWGPDIIGVIKGQNDAEDLARNIQADMVIYGFVEETPNGVRVRPEFYLDPRNFHDGEEVTGQYSLGSPILLPGVLDGSLDWRRMLNTNMTVRSQIISLIAKGLSYYQLHQYEQALGVFQSIEPLEWPRDEQDREQGKEVLYALIGFAAGKTGQYDLTESYLEKAIVINSEYARPYVGLANLNYIRALEPYTKSKNFEDVDQTLLDQCFQYLDFAVQAPEKPPSADVDTKIHFSRGQCYWLKTVSGQLPDFGLALNEFQQVIAAYDNGKNSRIKELAGEAYARLGLIYQMTNHLPEAEQNYQKAADLLVAIPTRQQHYQTRVADIQQTMSPSSP